VIASIYADFSDLIYLHEEKKMEAMSPKKKKRIRDFYTYFEIFQ
ncbi:12287_t:CDS:1, partial [Cetraspora pellucida]